jgi:hypothetical protein
VLGVFEVNGYDVLQLRPPGEQRLLRAVIAGDAAAEGRRLAEFLAGYDLPPREQRRRRAPMQERGSESHDMR